MSSRKVTTTGKSVESPSSVLFHADASDPDMLYFSRFSAFDPYLALSVDGRKIGISNSMEYNRMDKESDFDEILLLHEVEERAAKRFGLKAGTKPSPAELVQQLAHDFGLKGFRVSSRFPAGLAFSLRDVGLEIVPDDGRPFLAERSRKTAEEIKRLKKGNEASAAGFRVVAKTLAESKVKNGKLVHEGSYLTAERLRELISLACMEKGAIALHTITAAGDQACDCHEAGTGPIPANELIVVDIFPRRPEDGYWGDMTRTFLKGRASDAQRRLVSTVKEGQRIAIEMIKPGVSGGKVCRAVQDFFAAEGYETIRDSAQPSGFFHSLGHGIGLEVHEEPNIRLNSTWRFHKGMVVTIEPGLYYRGLGGCRIEDVIHVTPNGNELISKAPYRWEIR